MWNFIVKALKEALKEKVTEMTKEEVKEWLDKLGVKVEEVTDELIARWKPEGSARCGDPSQDAPLLGTGWAFDWRGRRLCLRGLFLRTAGFFFSLSFASLNQHRLP